MTKGKSPLFFKDYYYQVKYKCSFKALARRTIKPYMLVLEAGGGKRSVIGECNLKADHIVGMDIALDDIEENPSLDFKLIGHLENLPFKREVFDVIICRNVVEHLRNPYKVFKEFQSILKKEGCLLVRTPNLCNPIIVLSRILPLNMRTWVKKNIFHDSEGDTFPTYHRCNTKGRLLNAFNALGFQSDFHSYDGLMAYFDFSRILISFIVLYEKITDLKVLRWLKMWIILSVSKAD